MSALERPLVKVLGERTAKGLAGLGLQTLGDLLNHLPRRYDERGKLTDLGSLAVDDHVTVLAEVRSASVRRMASRSGSIMEVVVTDGTTEFALTFFNPRVQHRDLTAGTKALFSGKVTRYRNKLQLAQPAYQLLTDGTEVDLGSPLLPVYPASAGIESWKIAKAVRAVLDGLTPADIADDDPLPPALRRRHELPDLVQAWRWAHAPQSYGEVTRAHQRLAWDEALVLQVALARRRLDAERARAVPRPRRPGGLADSFDADLPFTLTDGQVAVGVEVAADLERTHPMHRLIQGEVGSGKTLVALRAMLQVVDSGGQAALLAPTEVLASQHARGLTKMLGPLASAGMLGGAVDGTRITLLTGSLTTAQRRRALSEVVSGEAGIVVGTHALLEPTVMWNDLALVVVDEQHRFGVEQRARLRSSAEEKPHLLVMTATPIPRTVAMTVFGDLEESRLEGLPSGRQPISSFVVDASKPAWVDRMWGRVRDEVAAGHQAYVVCPRIGDEEGKDLDKEEQTTAAVLDVLPALLAGPLVGLKVAVLHGRLPADEKDAVMTAFSRGETDVLVATTVIEVGVDVPNATAMVILDADRFGISQLHQLRGRVGRGSAASWCLLATLRRGRQPGAQAARCRRVDLRRSGAGRGRPARPQRGRRAGDGAVRQAPLAQGSAAAAGRRRDPRGARGGHGARERGPDAGGARRAAAGGRPGGRRDRGGPAGEGVTGVLAQQLPERGRGV